MYFPSASAVTIKVKQEKSMAGEVGVLEHVLVQLKNATGYQF